MKKLTNLIYFFFVSFKIFRILGCEYVILNWGIFLTWKFELIFCNNINNFCIKKETAN
jgi:nitrate reductase NapE component